MRIQTLVLASLVGFGGSCGSSQQKPTVSSDLSVVGTPTGELTNDLRVVLHFSKPMVTKADVGKPATQTPLSISPEIDGAASWKDAKTLVFEPSSSLAISTNYVATIPKGTKALDGHELALDHEFEFSTPRLTAEVQLMGSEDQATRDMMVRLSFNYDVPFAQVQENCKYVADKTSHSVKLAPDVPAGPARSYTVQPVAALTTDSSWKFSCSTALRGSIGNLGIAEPAEVEFRTYGPLKYVGTDPPVNGTDNVVPDETNGLSFAFTNPLAEPFEITISPDIRNFAKRCYASGYSSPGLYCSAELEPRTKYTIKISAKQKDRYGQELGEDRVIEFATTDALPTVSMESGYFVAELRRPVLPVWARNVDRLDVSAVEVTPANFHKIQPFLNWWEYQPTDFDKSKLRAKKMTMSVTGTKNKWDQYPIDPAKLFGGKPGPGMYYIEVGSSDVERYPFENGGVQKVLVNFTDIGVVSKLSATRGLVWATRLSTGKPLPGARVQVRDHTGRVTWSGKTDDSGVAYLPAASKLERRSSRTPDAEREFSSEQTGVQIYVTSGNDFTMVNPQRTGGLSAWNFNVSQDYDQAEVKLRGYMHTDRGLYRPGETVHIKGLARVTRLGAPLSVPRDKRVEVQVDGPRGKSVHTARARLTRFGGFWLDMELPGDARLGDYTIRAKLKHGTFTRSFMVEEYRPATFEIEGKADKERVVRSGSVKATISANYLYGAPLREGDAEVAVHTRQRRVSFPKWQEFRFWDERRYDAYYYQSDYSQELITEDTVELDKNGNASVNIAVSPTDISSDSDLLVRATVTAPSNEVITKSFAIPYFRSRRYFGIKSPGWFLDVGKKQTFEFVSVSPNGEADSGSAKLTITRRDWNCVWESWGYRGSYHCTEKKEVVVDKTLSFTAGKATSFDFTPKSGGDYYVVVEGKNNESAAAMEFYAWGDGGGSWRSSDSLTFDIIADKKEYRVGDTATLLLKTDLAKATGLVTIERDGVMEKRMMTLTPEVKHVEIPITEDHAPNVYVSVALVQGRMGKGRRGQPRMRMGVINLAVRPEDRGLKVSIDTDKKDYRPGETVKATVKVTDHAGRPVSAEVAVTAADEGVLSLIGYQTPDPTPTFYAPWGLGVQTATQLAYIRDIPGPGMTRPATGGDSGGGSVRSRFVSTAVWKPGAVTNSAGLATVTFEAPDNLTAFRVMAVAADSGHRFGSSDERFTVAKPLQLHRALPRFLTIGDELTGGVIVHNETGKAGAAKVKLEVDGGVTIDGDSEKTVQVAEGGRVPVLFSLEASKIEPAALTFSVKMNGESDAVQFELPVHHPSPERTEHIAHGSTTGVDTVAVKMPANAIATTAQVFVSIDPHGLAGIEDGLRDLIGYPYGCLEQTTSKVVPMIAVRSLAETLKLDGLSGGKIDGFVKAGIAKIGRHQTSYGGFSLWPGGEASTYYTAYALWGLHEAKKAGYEVDQSRIDEALNYLKTDGKKGNTHAPYYNEHGDLGSQAFALYVRAVLGDKDTQAATKLLASKDKLPIYGRAFLARALAAGLGNNDKTVTELVDDLGGLAIAATSKGELLSELAELRGYMSSDMRTNAIVLATLVEIAPKHAAIKPLVRVLMKQRRGQRYIDTQSNIYSLLALNDYAESVSSRPPSVTVQFGGKTLASGRLSGKQRIKVVSAALPAGGGNIDLKTKGEVHYNVEIRYREKIESLKEESNGLKISRKFLDEDGKEKKSFKVGDVVRVRLTSPLAMEVNHLMISDRLPAGFEPINTRFATAGVQPPRNNYYWGTYMEMHDERVDFASEYNWRRTYTREYLVRATSVGKFVLPPATAELMYEPEKNARNKLSHITIKAK